MQLSIQSFINLLIVTLNLVSWIILSNICLCK